MLLTGLAGTINVRESIVCTTEAHNKVILEGAYALFLGVTLMHADQDKLVRDIIVCVKVFHDLCSLVF